MAKGNQKTLKEDIFNILRFLASKDNLSQRDLSTHTGFSLGKTNYLLKELVKKDLLKIKSFISKGQKLNKVRYILTKKGFEEKLGLTYYFLQRKEKEYLELKKEAQRASDNSGGSK